jgi:hypothetical protein
VAHEWRKTLLSGLAALAIAAGTILALPGVAQAAGSLPCDIYGSAGTSCVSADSTVRALYSAYNGPLYQVQRASDSATTNIGLLTAGGYANAAAQDSFCSGTTCIITKIYDQSPQHNDLTIEGPGAAGGQDVGAVANALPLTVGGHAVYGLKITATTGYRHAVGAGVATGSQPEGMYMVASGTNVNDLCCSDFGNVEASEVDNGASHMDAVNLSRMCGFSPCTQPGPWVEADLENGVFQGRGSNPSDLGNASRFVTAMLKNNGTTTFAIKGGDATSGGLSTWYSGALPSGYSPMHLEGSIVLGTGGDNSNSDIGSFFEGVMTAGYPTDTADNSVQSNIVSAGYSGNSGAGPGGTITIPTAGKCVDVAGDDSGVDAAFVQLWDCQSQAADQHWTHNPDNTLTTLGRCLDITNNGTANGSKMQLYDCNGVPGQVWVVQANGSLLNPHSGRCLDDPSGITTNGTQLQIWDCNGQSPQVFHINGGGPITLPGGKCVDTYGLDTGGNGAAEQVWDCQKYAADQHWYHNANGTLSTFGVSGPGTSCLDIVGNGTANGTKIQLWTCSGIGGQVWQQQANGSLLNPQSGRCLDDPSGNTNDGVRLQIWDCLGDSAQVFTLH